uniref:Acyl-coenzyme A thioesterase 2, mitochondrial n=1 Tax=Rattus norvegicus TaxID=10116 RepID=ACOT2_RAT|nr:RecName: Full=Acyl-coenzyme A thioesterase 2, mitochondrial; Short=Acyl-CoA thioesterase 2; AltName: Full=ARTISt/p43; AltName: Full=Acyl coenzyme A thioester hydrolase; AltName: Full=MTE-I; AltName: Full=Very-long-chain acyl-CoA thioesterase; Flags: Precursor [Rattus norvegicus]CAA70513.1 mitochondrial very-long-chain acyl-CoA thioesterase [Rattus norvegicus]
MVASSFAVLRASRLCQWGWKSWTQLSGPPPLSTGGRTTFARTNATLSLEPGSRSCWDEPLSITVRGLAPEQPVTLRAALRDEKGALFRAHARYRADAGGELDLARAPALGGSFTGLEPMGLIWAMEPERPLWRLVKRDVQKPYVVELEVLDGHEPDGGQRLAQAVHERHFMAPGVRRVPVRDGRVRATLFLPPEPGPFPEIIDLFGVGGGLLEYRASLLAGKGFAVMALAYYNYDDLPKTMETMRIEYFEEAVNYLRGHPEVKGPGIGLLGISKGGELGLAMASFLKGITAAVVINGSVAAVGNTVCYKDETIPPVSLLRDKVKMTKDGLLDVVEALQSPLVDKKSFIPVERSDTTFLFLVGQDDHNWKSEFYAREASKRLQAHGKEKPQIICYPEAGHYIEPPYFPLCSAGMHLLVGANITFGGEPKPHSVAQLDAWQQLQTFFHKQLSGKS